MNPNWQALIRILKPFVDFEVGDTGDCPELDEILREVVSFKVLFEKKLQEEIEELEKEYCLDCQGLSDCQYCLGCNIGGKINKIKEIFG